MYASTNVVDQLFNCLLNPMSSFIGLRFYYNENKTSSLVELAQTTHVHWLADIDVTLYL